MKILKIRELGDPIIRKVAKVVSMAEIRNKKFHKFVENLIFTCKVKNGVGIAAPQIGEGKRVFVIWSHPSKRYKKAPKMEPLVIINPKIVSKSKKIIKDWEGCLSIPGIRGVVSRHASLDAEFIDITGRKILKKFSGFPARIFQHEFDHLNGVVFIDRVNLKDIVTEKEYKKIISKK